jgi:hypothetical protein
MKHEASTLSPIQLRAETDAEFAEAMWRFRHPEEGGEKLTFEAILAEALPRYGLRVSSLDTLSRFYRWLGLKRDFAAKRDAISTIKAEMAKDPSISPEQIEKAGRVMFLTDSYVEKDAKVFASMVKIGQATKSLEQRDKQLDQRDQELTQRETLVSQSERRISLLEKKAEFADAVKKAAENSQGGITAEQMAEIERKLKLM